MSSLSLSIPENQPIQKTVSDLSTGSTSARNASGGFDPVPSSYNTSPDGSPKLRSRGSLRDVWDSGQAMEKQATLGEIAWALNELRCAACLACVGARACASVCAYPGRRMTEMVQAEVCVCVLASARAREFKYTLTSELF